MKLTEQSLNKFYKDTEGNEYLVLQEVKSCCRMTYYLLNEVGTSNEYAYDSAGRRLDHRFKVDVDSKFNLKG